MYRIILFLILILILKSRDADAQNLSLYDLKIEQRINPLGIDVQKPRFSWKIQSSKRSVTQTHYEIRVFSRMKNGSNIMWNSGWKLSDQSIYVPYGGPGLISGGRYSWQVRIRDNYGKESKWSTIQDWEMAKLSLSDWSANWIEPELVTNGREFSVPVFAKSFDIPAKIRSARLYITSHGIYHATINGNLITENLFMPGWTSYTKRLQYQIYDVTSLLKTGQNRSLVEVADGWYRGYLQWSGKRNFYGKEPALLYQLEIELENGEMMRVVSDDTWKSSFSGSVKSADIYNGEIVDTRINIDTMAIQEWQDVRVKGFKLDNLIAQEGLEVRRHEYLKPKSIKKHADGEYIFDFGQNISGWVKLNIQGNDGDKVMIRHAEILDKDGDVYTANLRSAKQEDVYILNGKDQLLEPKFTFHGFRYAKLSNFFGDINGISVEAVAIYSAMDVTGDFVSSDTMVNKLQSNIQWGQKGNFLDIPTDCPQRDERIGWTGDAQVFFNTAAYNMDVNLFFKKWLNDLKTDQYENGNVPAVIPFTTLRATDGSAGWSDAATIVPWNHFLVYGDTTVLVYQYKSMKLWVDFITSESQQDLWKRNAHYGDWLFYSVNDDRHGNSAITDKDLIAQVFYVASVQNLINAARVLNHQSDLVMYEELLKRIKKAFLREFVSPSARLSSDTQTAYVLALQFDLFPKEMRKSAAERLVENISRYNYHLTTGFLGTPYLNQVLTRFGYTDVAVRLLLQQTYPSWLYPITKGATTVWERWDGIKPDGRLQEASMNSFNHYAYGAVGEWMYNTIAGIALDTTSVAYKHIIIKPHLVKGWDFAAGSLETNYGKISCSWSISDDLLHMDVTVPPNTTANVFLPYSQGKVILESEKDIMNHPNFTRIETDEKESTGYKIGSGEYHFTYELNY